MARLSDLPHVFRTVGPIRFAMRVWREVLDDHVFTWAAALAYSWLFSVFPFLIFLLALLPYLPEKYQREANEGIQQQISEQIPSKAGETLKQAVNNLFNPQAKGVLISVGILLALYAASGGMNATMAALDRCYDIEIGRPFALQRLCAVGLTVLVATLTILVLLLMPVSTQLARYLQLEGALAWLFNISRYGISFLLCLTILSLIYYFGPSVRSHWHWVTPGSLFVVAAWTVVGFGFRYYIDNFAAQSYDKTYGAVGSIVLLLMVFYLYAIVLLIGAEINSEVDFAVLGINSNSNTSPALPRANLSRREQRMLEELRRRRPAATRLADAGISPESDPAAAGPINPMRQDAAAPARNSSTDHPA